MYSAYKLVLWDELLILNCKMVLELNPDFGPLDISNLIKRLQHKSLCK
jgi:hypothetical protein